MNILKNLAIPVIIIIAVDITLTSMLVHAVARALTGRGSDD